MPAPHRARRTSPYVAERVAQSLTAPALGRRLRMIAANPREFDAAMRRAFIAEAAGRLDPEGEEE